MKKVVDVATEDGNLWERWRPGRVYQVHAIRFEDGSIWDATNGWRDGVRLTSMAHPINPDALEQHEVELPHPQWEYNISGLPLHPNNFNDLGNDGWELVAALDNYKLQGNPLFIFKRRKA